MFDFELEKEFREFLKAEFPGGKVLLVKAVGKPGVFTEFATATAARNLSGGAWRLPSEDERLLFRDRQAVRLPQDTTHQQ